jgi:hypothetical protein
MMFVTSIVTQMLKYSNKNEIIDWWLSFQKSRDLI